jgi:hypothetical protein
VELGWVVRPGAVVMYTGRFLHSAGLRVGPEGAKRFIVGLCDCALCASGRFILINEAGGPERHVAFAAVREVAKGERY